MDRLSMPDGPGQLRNFFANERNRMRMENPDLDEHLMRFLMTLPDEAFESEPRLYAQYGAGFAFYESGTQTVLSSSRFDADMVHHVFMKFMATQPYSSAERRLEHEFYYHVRGALTGAHGPLPPRINEVAVEHAIAFIGGYVIVNENS